MSMRPGGLMTALLDKARAVKPWRSVLIIVLALLAILLIATAVRSLEWRAGPEVAGLLYNARMVDQHGLLPYRDLFDVNAPGVFYLYALIGRLTGYSDGLALNAVNLAGLAAIMALTWGWLRRLSGLAGWTAAVLFGLCYLSLGPFDAILAPEFWLTLLLAAAMLPAAGLPRLDDRARCALIGLAFGLAAAIEPHVLIGLVPVGVFLWADHASLARRPDRGGAPLGGMAGAGLAGLALPWLALAIVLAGAGALGPYREILSGYAPLSAHFTNDLRMLSGPRWAAYSAETLLNLGKQTLWLPPAAAGLLLAFSVGGLDARGRRLAALILAMAAALTFYPALAGRFDAAHWLPMLYFLVALASLCLLPVRDPAAGRFLRAFPAVVLMLTLFLKRDVVAGLASDWADRALNGHLPPPPAEGRADAIAEYLRASLKPGERVQPLDWNGGVTQAMLLVDAPPATRFTADMLFLQDTSTPAIQGLRSELIDGLQADPPRTMIYVPGYRFSGGPDVSAEFPALQSLLDGQYTLAFIGGGYRVYERSDQAGAGRQGLIVYPQNWPPKPDGYLSGPSQGVLGLTRQVAANPQKLDRALSDFAAGRGRLTLELMSEKGGTQLIEAWLDAHGSKQSDVVINQFRVLRYVMREGAPTP